MRSTTSRFIAVAIGSLIIPLLAPTQSFQTTNQIGYAPSSENFANPERGFFHAFSPSFLGTERAPLTPAMLNSVRNDGLSMVRANYVFDEFRDAPLSQSALNEMASDFAAVRTAGLEIIVRVMYSFPCAGSLEPCGPSNYGPTDAALPIVLNHITSLAPLWRANTDIIAYLEMGSGQPLRAARRRDLLERAGRGTVHSVFVCTRRTGAAALERAQRRI
jgi:hypothetical protein